MNHNIDERLKEAMSLKNSGIAAPDRLLVFEARQAVHRRSVSSRLTSLAAETPRLFMLQPQRLGLAGLCAAAVVVFFLSISFRPDRRDTFYAAADQLAGVTGTTISATSATMLASIPTLRY
jgi:hypothetical protein